MKTFLRNSIVVALLIGSAAAECTLQGQGPKIHGVVIDPSLDEQNGVEGIYVYVDELDRKGKTIQRIGATTSGTGTDGKYSVQCDKKADKLVVWFLDSNGPARGYVYASTPVQPLSGRQELILNPAIYPQKGQSSTEVRSTMNSLQKVIPGLGSREKGWVMDYVVSAVREGVSDPNFRLGEELAEVDRLLKQSPGEFNVTENIAWFLDPSKKSVTKWQLPKNISEPVEVTTGRSTIEWTAGDHTDIYASNTAPSESGLVMLGHRKNAGRLNVYRWDIGNAESKVEWKQLFSTADVTSASGSPTQPFIVTGTSDGTVVLMDSKKPTETSTFEVGRTPVVVTAMSTDGQTFAAVTIDGSYGIWTLNAKDDMRSAEKVASGQMPKSFPTTMSFSPDRKSLVIGTGIGDRQSSIFTVELLPARTGKTAVTEYPAAITNIQFRESSNDFLAMSADGTTNVVELQYTDSGIIQSPKFKLSGIQTFGVLPTGDTAVLKVSGRKNPIAFPGDQLFNQSTFKDRVYGIEAKVP